jgi:opacity protein-like surface antigen
MKRLSVIAALAALSFSPTFAADLPIYSKAPAYVAPAPCQSAAACSGWYANFGLLNENANFISTGINGANNDFGLIAGGGYQLWNGPVLAGLQLNGGYEFTGQGVATTGNHFLGTALVQLGYNFFPAATGTTAAPSAATVPGQSPFSNIVPANLLAASTPYINAGGCLRHGILQGCAGVGIQTVIAQGWSTAFDYINMPSQKGQPDDQVFMLKVLKHF